MIILDEVATKIQKILNGTDTETSSLTNPTDFEFVVYTPGIHIDSLADTKSGKNFIPVFIDSAGGSHNPVPKLKQGNYSIPIAFYFPVRFKESFFALYDFLVSVFVGTYLNYGTYSGKAISNISVPRFGEISNLDFKQFAKWVEDKYRRPVEMMEEFLSMEINLYLTSSASQFVYGNAVSVGLSFNTGESILSDNDVVFEETTAQSQSQSQSQQLEGDGEAEGIAFGTAYGQGFSCYFKNTAFYKTLLYKWQNGEAQNLEITMSLTFDFGEASPTVYTKKVYLDSINMSLRKGQLITFTFSFAKLLDLEDEEEVLP